MVEMRLYYDDNGNVLCYTCEKPEGQYIVIDKFTYAECRFDIKIIDGKIVRPTESILVEKMVLSDVGYRTSDIDINLLVDDDFQGKTLTWKFIQNEFKRD